LRLVRIFIDMLWHSGEDWKTSRETAGRVIQLSFRYLCHCW